MAAAIALVLPRGGAAQTQTPTTPPIAAGVEGNVGK